MPRRCTSFCPRGLARDGATIAYEFDRSDVEGLEGDGPSAAPGGEKADAVAALPSPSTASGTTGVTFPPSTETPPLAVAPFDAKKAKEHQQAWAKHLGVPAEITNSIGMKLVLIPPGEFEMGSPDSDGNVRGDEKPQHRVRITKPFYLGKYLVTQEQWQAVMGNNPSHFNGPKNPVERISWDDCQVFLGKLNTKVGKEKGKFALPTEAQWEYSCRAGSKSRYCFGDEESGLAEYAWYDKNSGSKPHPVGEKKPNAWGLYDMHGNLWEWCQDWYDGYVKSLTDDPTGPKTGSFRVARGGGGWITGARNCCSAYRDHAAPGDRNYGLGLRVSLVLPPSTYAGETLPINEFVDLFGPG